MRRLAYLAVACLAALAGSAPAVTPRPPAFPQGVASGDVRQRSAVLWTRAPAAARVRFEWSRSRAFRRVTRRSVPTRGDRTARVHVRGLRPATRYWFRAVARGRRANGTFRTAPRSDAPAALRIAVGGDVGGQRVCRNARDGGYRIFGALDRLRPEVFVANGDMVYADGDCPANAGSEWPNVPGGFPNVAGIDWTDLPALHEAFRAHWRYNRADPFTRRFFARTPMLSQWDDHEVLNDFGAAWTYWNSAFFGRPGYRNVVRAGREAFRLYSPIDGDRIYRSFRYGRHVELFLLDGRSYRSRNDAPDGPGKTLLGAAQLDWLERGLARSTATWKIVSSDVPLSLPTGSPDFGTDSFVGFQHELFALLRSLDAADVRNLLFVVTDVHFAHTLRHDVDADGDGDRLRFHELVNGPLAAIRLLPVAPHPATNPTTLYAEGGLFNFGFLRVSASGRLRYDVRDIDGRVRPLSRLTLDPASGGPR